MSGIHAQHGWVDNKITREVRKRVLFRDRGLCQIGGPLCTVTATEVDHIVPLADGGAAHDETNLRAACKPCNVSLANHKRPKRQIVNEPPCPPSRAW
jgi:5-methylcytosine-specific restriction endonuclease McrA